MLDYISSGIPVNATQAGWGSVDVEYSLDQGNTWVNVITIDDSNHVMSSNCTTIDLTIPGADIPSGSDFQLKFISHWLSGDFFVYLDNLFILQNLTSIPNCDAVMISPTDGELTAPTTGLITWNAASGGVVGYKFSMGTTTGGTNLADQVLVEGGDTFYDAGSLTEGMTYYVSIIPYNNLGEPSCSEYSFSTYAVPTNDACADALEVVSLPYSNSQNAIAATNNDGFIFACGSGMNDGVWYSLAGNGEEITIMVNETSLWDSELGIYTGSCGNLVCLDFSDSSNDIEELTFTSVIGETYYINVGHYSGFMDNSEGAFDINITSMPLCSIPSDVSIENITPTSADVSWIENGMASEWQIVYGEEGFNPEVNGISIFDNDGELGVQITGLTANTTYDVYVFAVCGTNLSDLLGPNSFTTEELSVKSSYFSDFSVYPNPTSSVVNLKSAYPIEKLSLYTLLGKKVYSSVPNSLHTEVSLDQLNSGVYLLQVMMNDEIKTFKLMKK